MMDYRLMLESDRKHKEKMSSSYINRVINSLSEESSESSKGKAVTDHKPNYYYRQNRGKLLRDQRYLQKDNEQLEIKKWPKKASVKHFQTVFENDIEDSNAKQDAAVSNENKHKHLPLYNIFEYGLNNTGRYWPDSDGIKKKKAMTFTKTAGNVDQLEMELQSVLGNTTCDWSEGGPYMLMRQLMRRCVVGRRNGYDDDFLRTLTRTMNRYSEASFEFTEDMVQLIMDRVFGTGIRASGDLLDVGKLLHYLRNAVEKHKMHRSREATIVLKPRHCLSLSVPGCFCRPGFVEKSGQCVLPADCNIEPSNAVYLTRIIVH